MAASTLADGQCAKNDGRGWHCKSQRSGGRSYCEKHYLQSVRSKSKSKSKSRVSVTDTRSEAEVSSTAGEDQCAARNGKGWRCKSRRIAGSRHCEKHHLREVSRVRVSDASASKRTRKKQSTGSTVDDGRCARSDGRGWRCSSPRFGGRRYKDREVEVSSTADEDQCAARNGKGWRCKSRRIAGSRHCEKHHLREVSRVRVSDASASKRTRKKQSTGSTVDDGRCARSDGRGWRCSSLRFGGRRYCEKHWLQKFSGAGSKFKGRVSHTTVEDEKKLEGEASGASSSSEISGKEVKSVEGKSRKSTKRSDQSAEQKRRARPWKERKLEGAEEMKRPRKKSRACETEMGGGGGGVEEADRVMELGQVWAFPKGSDGSPRSYARIDRIIPLPAPSVVRVTPLVPHPVTDDEKLFAEQGLSLACGLFKASESIVTMEISAFTHKARFEIEEEKQGSFYKIFPKEGEIWAIYWRWDALRKTFDYQLVEVESDFDEEDGVKVFALVKVEGRDGVYRRHQYVGFHLVRSFSRGFMIMFSHKVPSSRIVEGGEMLWKVMLHWMG